MPWILPNCLFKDCISCECGAASQLFLPSFFSAPRQDRLACISPNVLFLPCIAHTLRPSLIRDRVGNRQAVRPIDQAGDKNCCQRYRNIPAVRLVQQCTSNTGCGDEASGICESHRDGCKCLDSEIGREDGALQLGELGTFKCFEGRCRIHEGLSQRIARNPGKSYCENRLLT